MKKLYANGRIKVDLIEDALNNAIDEGKLRGVQRTKIKYFVQGFEEKMAELKNKVGTQITRDEVKELLKSLGLNKHDKILDSDLRAISEIMLDKDFDIE